MLFHNGNITRHNSFGTALHKLEYFLLGGRVHVIKEYASNPPSLTTVFDKEVVITPRSSSRGLLTQATILKQMSRTPSSYMAQQSASKTLMTSQSLQCQAYCCFTDCHQPGWSSTLWKALPPSLMAKPLMVWSLPSYTSPHSH